ncbi:hypothetical protein [Salipiger sp.]|uniref:hypothetical protein n=1 Tax=Salipiger sp. TaxID=2078585 RepID=UPI003A972E48
MQSDSKARQTAPASTIDVLTASSPRLPGTGDSLYNWDAGEELDRLAALAGPELRRPVTPKTSPRGSSRPRR